MREGVKWGWPSLCLSHEISCHAQGNIDNHTLNIVEPPLAWVSEWLQGALHPTWLGAAVSNTLKGSGFNFRSGYISRFQFRSLVGVQTAGNRSIDWCFSFILMSLLFLSPLSALSLSLPPPTHLLQQLLLNGRDAPSY